MAVEPVLPDGMTPQEAYEQIRAWFSKPDAQLAWDTESGGCVYRGNSDPHSPLRCAVGCLIPDDKYKPSFEHCGLRQPGDDLDGGMVVANADLRRFLSAAQDVHDHYASLDATTEEFLVELDTVAERHGLELVQP